MTDQQIKDNAEQAATNRFKLVPHEVQRAHDFSEGYIAGANANDRELERMGLLLLNYEGQVESLKNVIAGLKEENKRHAIEFSELTALSGWKPWVENGKVRYWYHSELLKGTWNTNDLYNNLFNPPKP